MFDDEKIRTLLNQLGEEEQAEFISYLQTLLQAQEDELLHPLDIPA